MFCSAFRRGVLRSNISNQYRQYSGSVVRRYAVQAAKPRSTLPRPPRTGGYAAPNRPPTEKELAGLSRVAKIDVLEKLFQSGAKILYRAPGRLAIFRFQNYLLAIVLAGAVLGYQKLGLLDLEEFKRKGISRVIYFLYMVIAAFMSGLAGILLYRTRNHIHAIRLVERSNQVFLSITTRRFIPFLKSEILAGPENLVLRSKMIAPQSIPEGKTISPADQPSVSKALFEIVRQFFYNVKAASHAFFTNEGMIKLDVVEEGAKEESSSGYKLDITGEWQVPKEGELPTLFSIAKVEDRPLSLGIFSLFFKR